MARPYIPDPNTISPSGPFTPFPKLDRENDHAPVTETFTVPGIANLYALRLDYAILAQATLTIKDTATNAEFGIVQWETTPGPGQVAVFKDRGLLRFHSGAQGKNVSATYQPIGTVIDAQYEMTLQKYIESAVATALNAALKNAANEFTAKQTITTDTENEALLKLSAAQGPGIEAEDRVFGAIASLLFSGDLATWFSSHGIEAPYFTGNHFGDGGGLSDLDASNITSGTLALARLHSNVARRDQANTFSASQTFNGGAVLGGQFTLNAAFFSAGSSVNITDTTQIYFGHANNTTLTLPLLSSVAGVSASKIVSFKIIFYTGGSNFKIQCHASNSSTMYNTSGAFVSSITESPAINTVYEIFLVHDATVPFWAVKRHN